MLKQLKLTLLCVMFGTLLLQTSLLAKDKSDQLHQDVDAIEFYTQLDEILLLIQKKLSATHVLARWMWNHDELIDNPEREQRMTDFALECAEKNKIPTAWAKWFVYTQIESAKMILREDYEAWIHEDQHTFTDVCDIKALHNYFIRLTEVIIQKLGLIYPSFQNYPGKELVQQPLSHRDFDHISPEVWSKAMKPFSRGLDHDHECSVYSNSGFQGSEESNMSIISPNLHQ